MIHRFGISTTSSNLVSSHESRIPGPLPYALELADKGGEKAMKENTALRKGLNVYKGILTNGEIARALGLHYVEYQAL